jgi:hypothetical protein
MKFKGFGEGGGGGYFVETSKKVLVTVLPAIPLSALCHEHFLKLLLVVMFMLLC